MTVQTICFAFVLLLPGQTVSYVVTAERLPLDRASLEKQPQVERTVMEQGQKVVYRGVPLRAVLAERASLADAAAEQKAIHDLVDAVLLVRASDQYQTAVSAVAALLDAQGERYLLALQRNGKPLDSDHGPLMLITTQEPERVRWVRMITEVELIRLPRSDPKRARVARP